MLTSVILSMSAETSFKIYIKLAKYSNTFSHLMKKKVSRVHQACWSLFFSDCSAEMENNRPSSRNEAQKDALRPLDLAHPTPGAPHQGSYIAVAEAPR